MNVKKSANTPNSIIIKTGRKNFYGLVSFDRSTENRLY